MREDESHDPSAALPSAELFEDFEQQRVLASAKARLFGGQPKLEIGRYRVERRLGAGAMGEVYLAVDRQLKRKVALKRVLADTGTEPERERRRLRREAQALARLRHPNVVQVYEIGEHLGKTFVAMEYVDGQTLAAWLREAPRTWTLVLERFVAAGRGLAAAHDAGLVHRDFKPENVLISTSGEVRVADFGLVLAGEDQRLGDTITRSLAPSIDMRLSTAGAVIGTVRYMPIEQLRGAKVDARSDQFSFCVALYEALWGVPPFSIESLVERIDALEQNEPRTPPSAAIPAALWRILRRGLDVEPTRRWPDMDSLLDALEGAPRRRRRRAALVASSALLAGTLGLALAAHDRSSGCAHLDAELVGTWEPETRTQLDATLASLDARAAHVADSRARVRELLDSWAEHWLIARTKLCQAQQSEAATPGLATRRRCLMRQRWRVSAVVEGLRAAAEPDELAEALEAVLRLPDAGDCALGGMQLLPPPREELAELEQQLELAAAHQALGRHAQAHATLDELEQRAARLDATHTAPLRAQVGALRSRSSLAEGALQRSITQLEDATDLAEIGRHDQLAARSWIELTLRRLDASESPAPAASALRRAEVACERARDMLGARDLARLRYASARVALARGEPGALERLREAVDEAERANSPEWASYLVQLSRAPQPEASAAQARARALTALEAQLGPQHPTTLALRPELERAR